MKPKQRVRVYGKPILSSILSLCFSLSLFNLLIILVVALRLCQQQDRSYLTQLLPRESRREIHLGELMSWGTVNGNAIHSSFA